MRASSVVMRGEWERGDDRDMVEVEAKGEEGWLVERCEIRARVEFRNDDDEMRPNLRVLANDDNNIGQDFENKQNTSHYLGTANRTNTTSKSTTKTMSHLATVAILSILLLQLLSRNPHNRVHCFSSQIFSSPSRSSLNIIGQTQQQQQQGLSPSASTSAVTPRRDRRAPPATAYIEAGEPAGEFSSGSSGSGYMDGNQQPLAVARDPEEEEEATSRRQAPAPEMLVDRQQGATSNLLAGGSKLRIVRLMAPEATQNGTQNVTLDCMFKFDKNLDQRLTIKWFFNDELEPIYQWIPELNKRVYSDKYERHLDKSYEVSDDVDYMLQSYRWLIASGGISAGPARAIDPSAFRANAIDSAPSSSTPTTSAGHIQQEQPIMMRAGGQPNHHNDNANHKDAGEMDHEEKEPEEEEAAAMVATDHQQQQQQQRHRQLADRAGRRLLAGRLSKLAKLGGRHSRQLLETLRLALHMEELEFSRFRALRLIRPTSELNGRFTCSVSSLDGDDLRSTKLVVYEPAKSFSFNVSRLPTGTGAGQQYNLSCQAGHVFPQPTLTLYRYRAGPLDSGQQPAAVDYNGGQAALGLASSSAASNSQQKNQLRLRRPKLAATLLRQEVLGGTQSQISRTADNLQQQQQQQQDQGKLADFEGLITNSPHYDNNEILQQPSTQQPPPPPAAYDIISWALVEESSLSSNVVTQFECQLTIEGTGYEQRQSLALQRGWHVNSAALTSRHTLVGLFSALASLLCLMLALVSSLLIFRLLKRHAKNRVHQLDRKSASDDDGGSSGSGGVLKSANLTGGGKEGPHTGGSLEAVARTPTNGCTNNAATDTLAPDAGPNKSAEVYNVMQERIQRRQPAACLGNGDSDGVYRVPEPKSYGTRFVIGPGGGSYFGGGADLMASPPPPPRPASSFAPNSNKQHYLQRQQQSPAIITLESHIKPLYC